MYQELSAIILPNGSVQMEWMAAGEQISKSRQLLQREIYTASLHDDFGKLKEAGRKETIVIYPIAQKELSARYNRHELKERLDEFLTFGSYTAVVTATTKQEKIKVLQEFADSCLLKDILALARIRSPKTLLNLLKLLAFQVGNLVSMNELKIIAEICNLLILSSTTIWCDNISNSQVFIILTSKLSGVYFIVFRYYGAFGIYILSGLFPEEIPQS